MLSKNGDFIRKFSSKSEADKKVINMELLVEFIWKTKICI